MADYTLTVQLDDKWRKAWAAFPDMKLCFASTVQSNNQPFANVVASTNNIAPTTDITWTEKYRIAASDQQFSNGAKFSASSDKIGVKFRSKTVIEQNWDINTNNDESAPDNGFLFFNNRLAAAVLYKEIKGEFKPIYFTHIGQLPLRSTEKLIPKVTVYVWYSSSYKSETMSDDIMTQSFEVEMKSTEQTVYFDADGNWHLKS